MYTINFTANTKIKEQRVIARKTTKEIKPNPRKITVLIQNKASKGKQQQKR